MLKQHNPIPKILTKPSRKLSKVSELVDFEKFSMADRVKLVKAMGNALLSQKYGDKLGIAAPQIGVNLRVMIVRGNVMFNPEWTIPKVSQKVSLTEACYSVPNKFYTVERDKYGWAKWMTIDGRVIEDKLSGLPAIIFQHELSHLDGKCCDDLGVEVTPPPGVVPFPQLEEK